MTHSAGGQSLSVLPGEISSFQLHIRVLTQMQHLISQSELIWYANISFLCTLLYDCLDMIRCMPGNLLFWQMLIRDRILILNSNSLCTINFSNIVCVLMASFAWFLKYAFLSTILLSVLLFNMFWEDFFFLSEWQDYPSICNRDALKLNSMWPYDNCHQGSKELGPLESKCLDSNLTSSMPSISSSCNVTIGKVLIP